MSFQTVFYGPSSLSIIKVLPNQYIKSKFDKMRLCPGYETADVNFLYFKSSIPVIPGKHKIKLISPTHPPIIVDEADMPLIYFAAGEPFLEAIKSYKNIILDFQDSMGDNLYRAACALEAQKVYPDINFLCKIEEQYKPIISLVPGLTIFKDYAAHNVLAKDCKVIEMSAKLLADPLGNYFSAPSRYGLYLGLTNVPYDFRLNLPTDLDKQCEGFLASNHIADADKVVVMQLRTKGEESRSWSKDYINILADLLKQQGNCEIFYLGTPSDLLETTSDITNLAGKSSWLETLCLLTKAAQVFCIDSAVLHLCRAIGVQPITLYGRTDPRGVLGKQPTRFDLGASDTDRRSPTDKVKPFDVIAAAYQKEPARPDASILTIDDTSQHGDQEIIFQYFIDHPPKYKQLVDVGAYGKEMSNSFGLLQAGWKGYLIEAHPNRCKFIKKDFAGLDCFILNMGVGTAPGKMPLFLHTVPAHNSFLPDWYPDTLSGGKRLVNVLPLEMILDQAGVPVDFDFLTIDTEGLDFKIMEHFFTTSKYRPSLIITECTSYPAAEDFFRSYGYKLLAFTGEQNFGNYIFERLSQ